MKRAAEAAEVPEPPAKTAKTAAERAEGQQGLGQPAGIYHIHDNGGRPFKVEVQWPGAKAQIKVFKMKGEAEEEEEEEDEEKDEEDKEEDEEKDDDDNEDEAGSGAKVRVLTAGDLAQQLFGDPTHPLMVQLAGGPQGDGDGEEEVKVPYEEEPTVSFSADRVFVGQSPEHSVAFDGNSILLHLEDLKYVFIGEEVFSFAAKSRITRFVSPVGNSDVPYPWAMDEQGFCYLMTSSVILSGKNLGDSNAADFDPYDIFFDRSLITADIGCVPPQQPVTQFQGITEFWIGEDQYTLRYEPQPEEDFDRLSQMGELSVKKGDAKIKLSKADFVKLKQDFAAEMGFEALHTETVVERQI
ncbi:unnamed protein product [Symbiodinium natans]|uniref:Uncharacterized protein n=1 Tax=Symbiodinium natans TaxID=878477 RepID=A0A812HY26_9DINO|nr:unnamed protein product [Symbiodinium natans]